jgi:hypothetical protein
MKRNGPDEIHVEVQKVTHPSRVHIDIETYRVFTLTRPEADQMDHQRNANCWHFSAQPLLLEVIVATS